jgi:hypothetical protein
MVLAYKERSIMAVSGDEQQNYVNLVIQLLVQAIEDYEKFRNAKKRSTEHNLWADAALWINCDDDDPWSFKWCCEVVGYDYQAIRGGINRRDRKHPITAGFNNFRKVPSVRDIY